MSRPSRKISAEDREKARQRIAQVDAKLKAGQLAIRPPVKTRYQVRDAHPDTPTGSRSRANVRSRERT